MPLMLMPEVGFVNEINVGADPGQTHSREAISESYQEAAKTHSVWLAICVERRQMGSPPTNRSTPWRTFFITAVMA